MRNALPRACALDDTLPPLPLWGDGWRFTVGDVLGGVVEGIGCRHTHAAGRRYVRICSSLGATQVTRRQTAVSGNEDERVALCFPASTMSGLQRDQRSTDAKKAARAHSAPREGEATNGDWVICPQDTLDGERNKKIEASIRSAIGSKTKLDSYVSDVDGLLLWRAVLTAEQAAQIANIPGVSPAPPTSRHARKSSHVLVRSASSSGTRW